MRFRKPLFGETGHTIMNLLAVSSVVYHHLFFGFVFFVFSCCDLFSCERKHFLSLKWPISKAALFRFSRPRCLSPPQDFRNYQYTLPVVKGLVVDMEVKKTTIKIPSNRYNEVPDAVFPEFPRKS